MSKSIDNFPLRHSIAPADMCNLHYPIRRCPNDYQQLSRRLCLYVKRRPSLYVLYVVLGSSKSKSAIDTDGRDRRAISVWRMSFLR
mmetsp:Transcript_31613/g.76728  ORF Transcript_31613/g.76728 Transcript_31613/m.76728 type:complete len:86 (+) Transcript_31613:2660-2917(+)